MEGDLLMILHNQPSASIETQRENIFHTRCNVLENICSLIVDGGSCCNCCSTRLIEKLNLQVVPHPKTYNLQWINENGELRVDKQVEIKFFIGNYKDKVLCDVVPMEACHILLGRPWQFDKKILHDGLTNKIYFIHKNKKFVLNPLPLSQVVKDQIQIDPAYNSNVEESLRSSLSLCSVNATVLSAKSPSKPSLGFPNATCKTHRRRL